MDRSNFLFLYMSVIVFWPISHTKRVKQLHGRENAAISAFDKVTPHS